MDDLSTHFSECNSGCYVNDIIMYANDTSLMVLNAVSLQTILNLCLVNKIFNLMEYQHLIFNLFKPIYLCWMDIHLNENNITYVNKIEYLDYMIKKISKMT